MPPMSAATSVVVLGSDQRGRRRTRHSTAERGDGGYQKDPSDLFMKFQSLRFRMDILHERLEVEDGLLGLLQSLPLFLLCLTCFLVAISTLAPPAETSAIHQHLESHFYLDTVYSVTDLAGVYSYLTTFESQNQELRPTSSTYWCEKRYYEYSWDDHYLVPTSSCNSPRYNALSLLTGSQWNASNDTSSTESHRRLASTLEDDNASGATHPYPPCEDYDEKYQVEENDPNVTCSGDALHACRTDIGILFCPKTCGYCAPFTYEPLKRFDKPQLTLLPSVVYQSRLATTDCSGFASWFQSQNYNPVLLTLPALDGQKNGTLLTCVDRTQQYSEDYAFYLTCPTNTPALRCQDGRIGLTAKQLFHGSSVYPKMLIESTRDLEAMQKVGWIDAQTEKLSISTMIYTEGIEMFTSLTVEFSFDYAGNIVGSVQMISYRDLVNSTRDTFFALLLTTCLTAAVSVVSLTVYLLRHPETCNWGLVLFEIFSRSLFLVYPSILLVTWMQQVYMSHEFELLLQTFLETEGLDEEHFSDSLKKYFEVKTEVYEEVEWLETHRLASYGMLYVQFLQAVLYFSAHPRVAMLTRTVKKALWNMVHFFVVFAILFLMLAFMAHFLLGGTVHLFGTFPDACATQVRMLFGEFIFADGAEKLSGSMSAMYWVYAASFMLVVFFTLLNFFLAIIVDAFVDVKTECDDLHCTRNVFTDFCSLPHSWYLHRKYGLPARHSICAFLDEALEVFDNEQEKRDAADDAVPLMEAERLLEKFGCELKPGFCQLLLRVDRLSRSPVLHFAAKEGLGPATAISRESTEDKLGFRKVLLTELRADSVLPNTVAD